jgi:hypothetical protein
MAHHANRLLQNIFKSSFHLYNQPLPLKDIKAADAIMHCRTTNQGYDQLSCINGHEDKQLHSCRHRSCPLCAARARHHWIEAQKNRLLDCPHHHLVFTLPHEYLPLWQYNRAWFTSVLFQVCRDTLMTLLKDKRYLGATPGILMTLHTWGRQLNCHPHIHALVTAGGLTSSNQWQASEHDFLLPVRIVKALYKGKLQAAIRAALDKSELTLPTSCSYNELKHLHRGCYKKQWSVRIMPQYAQGRSVMLYLSRYLKGGPLHPKQIVYCDSRSVRFHYKDHRDNKTKLLSLKTTEFIRRILWHVPVPGLHVVRHYGLYASQSQAKRNQCRKIVGGIIESVTETGQVEKELLHWLCRTCGERLRRSFTVYPRRRIENSYKKNAAVPPSGFVQQGVEVGTRIRAPDPKVLH